MEGWWGTHKCYFLLDRVKAAACHVPVSQKWLEQVELLILQAQALQQQSLTQQDLLTELAVRTAQKQPDANSHGAPAVQAQDYQDEQQQRQQQGQTEHVHQDQALAPSAAHEQLKAATPMPVAGGEELLRAVFSVADTPTPDEIKALAWQTGRSQGHIRSYFNKLRSSIQAFLQRAVAKERQLSKAAALEAAVQDASENSDPHNLEQHSSKLTSQLNHLASLLDRKGAINMQAFGASSFVPLMKNTHSYEVREAQLRALNATPAKVSYKLATGPLLDVLESWLNEGDADQQHKFVREVLGTIQRLPVSWPLLQGSSLINTAARFAAARNERTAAKAQLLLKHWGQRFDDLAMASVIQKARVGKGTTFLQAQMPNLPRKRAGSHRSGHRRLTAGAAAPPSDLRSASSALAAAAVGPVLQPGGEAQQGQQEEGSHGNKGASLAVPLGCQLPRKNFTQPKPAHYSTRPTSVDDIRKMKQKQANQGLLPHQRGPQPMPGAIAAGRGGGRGAGMPDQGRPRPAGSAQPPPAKRMAVGGRDERVPPTPASAPPPGMVLMEELQQHQNAGGGGAGAGGHDDEELPPEAIAALKEYRERMRQRQAFKKAEAVTADPMLQQEIAKVIVDHDTKAIQMEEKAEAKRKQKELKKATSTDPSQLVYAFQVRVPWYTPALVPYSYLEQVAVGEDSFEWAAQEERASRLPPVRYGPSRPPPPTPAEPAEQGPRGHPPPLVPWLPLDPSEQEMQNRRLWDSGVRLPSYAVPYPGATAGMMSPPTLYQPLPGPPLVPQCASEAAPALPPQGTPSLTGPADSALHAGPLASPPAGASENTPPYTASTGHLHEGLAQQQHAALGAAGASGSQPGPILESQPPPHPSYTNTVPSASDPCSSSPQPAAGATDPYSSHHQYVAVATPAASEPLPAYAGYTPQQPTPPASGPLAYTGYKEPQQPSYPAYRPHQSTLATSQPSTTHPAYSSSPAIAASQPPHLYASCQAQQPYAYALPASYAAASAPQATYTTPQSTPYALPSSTPAYHPQPSVAIGQAYASSLPQDSHPAYAAPTPAAPSEQQKQAQALAMLASNPTQAQSVLAGLAAALRTRGGSEQHTGQLAQLQQLLQQHQQTQQQQGPRWQ